MIKRKIGRTLTMLLTGVSIALAATGCGNSGASGDADLEDVKVVLNWFAAPGHGGIYAAQEQGYYEEKGLNVTIEPGGPQVSSIQIVASGKAEFGLAHGDQVLIARNQGIELVALAAINQRSPQAFMFHKGHGIESFEELNGRKAFIQTGIPYWDYLKTQYDLSNVKELPYLGDSTNFINDKESAEQVYVMGEPYFMKEQGIETEVKFISDSGYDPYNYVLYTTKDYLDKNEETVRSFVSSMVKGWSYYKKSPDEILEIINEFNPDMTFESLKHQEESFREYIYGFDAAEHGVGYMTEERWMTLIDQLHTAGLLKEKFNASDMFTTAYLSEE
ncbi:ABC transporter substrate-binding protein [Neobacillus mesonae]|nr:ABC transporter substrate-binding protein [Neobacillus mesonae]